MASAATALPATESLWSSILKDVTSSRVAETKYVLLLGDRGTGKSTLVRRWKGGAYEQSQQQSQHNTEVALAYTYLEVKEDDDVVGRLGVWQLEGDEAFGDLLRWALTTPGAFEHSAVVIALDWSKPSELEKSLLKWMDLLQRTVHALGLSRDRIEEAQRKIYTFLQTYNDNASNTVSDASVASGSTQVLLPLESGVLTDNIGMPVLIAVTKSDVIDNLAKLHDLGDAQLDFIQQTLRRHALRYGAGLAYVSAAQNKNVDLTLRYLVQRLVSSSSERITAQHLASKDAIFIPAGWDTHSKIALLTADTSIGKKPGSSKAYPIDTPFAVVVPPPEDSLPSRGAHGSTVSESEEAFLQRLASDPASVSTSQPFDSGRPGLLNNSGSFKDLNASGGANGVSSSSISSSAAATGKSPRNRSTKPADSRTSTPAAQTNPSEAAKAGDTEQYQHFFQSLLRKGTSSSARLSATSGSNQKSTAQTATTVATAASILLPLSPPPATDTRAAEDSEIESKD